MDDSGNAADDTAHRGDTSQLQHIGPVYQNSDPSHYETPIDSSRQHERSGSAQLDKNSMDSYGFNHVYANPSFSGYPEIPAPDYPTDGHERSPQHSRRSSDSSRTSNSSHSRSEHPSSSTTRRASSPAIQGIPYPENEFHNVPLGMSAYERPPSDSTITVEVVPDDYSYWTIGMYFCMVFVLVMIIVLIIWALLYYGV